MDKIVLIGFSGSGKSTLGPMLAKKMNLKFIDLDSYIEQKEKLTITDIFANKGEKCFRELELNYLEKLSNKKSIIISLGGGAMMNSSIRKLIKNSFLSIYLRCSQKELYHRLKDKTDRPLLKTDKKWLLKETIKTLLARRKKYYETADIIISTTNDSKRETVTKIQKKIKNYGSHKS